jgi:predicted ATPase/DNA-binding winged helix-turn-helix (wHTH) protein
MTLTKNLKSSFEPSCHNCEIWQATNRAFLFGPFRLLPGRRLLLDGESQVQLGSRAFEVLLALIEHKGELVSKAQLMHRVWPSTHVDEGNLKFQVAALRRALGDGKNGRRYLETSPGQGYRFVAPVSVDCDAAALGRPVARTNPHNLPSRTGSLIGRSDLVSKLVDRLPGWRLITVTGSAGIGKTSVAIAVAERLIEAYEDGVWLIDLAELTATTLITSSIAHAIRIQIAPGDPLSSLLEVLRDKRMLLVLDNCSHALEAAAPVAAQILKASPGLHIIATSREPLRVNGEHIYHLGPLESPPASPRFRAEEALRFPAVQLFAEQVAANIGEFELRDEDANTVGEICRKLDGIPLAIELAAARVAVLGLPGLATQLERHLDVLTYGQRTAGVRHRTMRAALDWSYECLTSQQRAVFRRLALFSDGFPLSAAVSAAADASSSPDETIELVLDLAAKSLLVADAEGSEPHFRLLNTTRSYALEKLINSGECATLTGYQAARVSEAA